MFKVRAKYNAMWWNKGDIFIADGYMRAPCCDHELLYHIPEVNALAKCGKCETTILQGWWAAKSFDRLSDVQVEDLIESFYEPAVH